jgi:hypothetical protein
MRGKCCRSLPTPTRRAQLRAHSDRLQREWFESPQAPDLFRITTDKALSGTSRVSQPRF